MQILSKTEEELQSMLNRIVKVRRTYDMEINMMRISKPDQPVEVSTTGDKRSEEVEEYKYLVSVIIRALQEGDYGQSC